MLCWDWSFGSSHRLYLSRHHIQILDFVSGTGSRPYFDNNEKLSRISLLQPSTGSRPYFDDNEKMGSLP